jgi:CRISPR system Cascade subunit CasD
MSSDRGYLALLLNAPMQSWGFSSQFERRTTALSPSKSGIAGLLCAALGCAKASQTEADLLAVLRSSDMLAIALSRSPEVRRMEDFHTVLETRRASNKPNEDPVITRREYLLDGRFGIVLNLPAAWAHNLAPAVQNPVWGIWFGRKCCIPAEPVYRGVYDTEDDALHHLLANQPRSLYTMIRDAGSFESATDTLRDQPISFGSPQSSGSHLRQYGIRRIVLTPAEQRRSP